MSNPYKDLIIELAKLRNEYNENPNPELGNRIFNIYSAIYTMYVDSLYYCSKLSGAAKKNGFDSNKEYGDHLKQHTLYNRQVMNEVFGAENEYTNFDKNVRM